MEQKSYIYCSCLDCEDAKREINYASNECISENMAIKRPERLENHHNYSDIFRIHFRRRTEDEIIPVMLDTGIIEFKFPKGNLIPINCVCPFKLQARHFIAKVFNDSNKK